MPKFPPSPNREAAKQALREGMIPEECAFKFNLSIRTAYRYLKDVRDEKREVKSSQPKEARSTPIKIAVEMEFNDALKLLKMLRRGDRP